MPTLIAWVNIKYFINTDLIRGNVPDTITLKLKSFKNFFYTVSPSIPHLLHFFIMLTPQLTFIIFIYLLFKIFRVIKLFNLLVMVNHCFILFFQ